MISATHLLRLRRFRQIFLTSRHFADWPRLRADRSHPPWESVDVRQDHFEFDRGKRYPFGFLLCSQVFASIARTKSMIYVERTMFLFGFVVMAVAASRKNSG
jgi:hypothetical protein